MYINNPGHMTKMGAMPPYMVKTLNLQGSHGQGKVREKCKKIQGQGSQGILKLVREI